MEILTSLPGLHEYWARPKGATKGDTDIDAIHLAVGATASTWETVELGLAGVFTQYVRGPYPAAQRVFGLIVSAGAKIDALNAAAEVAFYWKSVIKEDQEHYALLMKHYKDASARRNEIVHAFVVRFTKDGIDQGFFLTPPFHSTNKNELPWVAYGKDEPAHPSRYPYTSDDVRYFIQRFVLLRQWVSEFAAMIETKYP